MQEYIFMFSITLEWR